MNVGDSNDKGKGELETLLNNLNDGQDVLFLQDNHYRHAACKKLQKTNENFHLLDMYRECQRAEFYTMHNMRDLK